MEIGGQIEIMVMVTMSAPWMDNFIEADSILVGVAWIEMFLEPKARVTEITPQFTVFFLIMFWTRIHKKLSS